MLRQKRMAELQAQVCLFPNPTNVLWMVLNACFYNNSRLEQEKEVQPPKNVMPSESELNNHHQFIMIWLATVDPDLYKYYNVLMQRNGRAPQDDTVSDSHIRVTRKAYALPPSHFCSIELNLIFVLPSSQSTITSLQDKLGEARQSKASGRHHNQRCAIWSPRWQSRRTAAHRTSRSDQREGATYQDHCTPHYHTQYYTYTHYPTHYYYYYTPTHYHTHYYLLHTQHTTTYNTCHTSLHACSHTLLYHTHTTHTRTHALYSHAHLHCTTQHTHYSTYTHTHSHIHPTLVCGVVLSLSLTHTLHCTALQHNTHHLYVSNALPHIILRCFSVPSLSFNSTKGENGMPMIKVSLWERVREKKK